MIDTCIWVDVERKTLVPNDVERFTGRDPIYMSPVTVAELSAGVENTQDRNAKAKRQAALAGRLKKEGSAREHRIQDLWIAASAIQHGYKLLTRNVKNFKDIPGLDLVLYAE